MTSLQNLVDKVRLRQNLENSQFVTDDELAIYLNDSLAEMDDILVHTYDDYKVNIAEIDSVQLGGNLGDGYKFFSVPDDFLVLRGVDRLINGKFMTIDPFGMPKRNMFSFPLVNYVYGYLGIFYRLIGNQIQIIPEANAVASYRIWYVPKYTTLALTDSLATYMDVQSWSEYAVTDTCIKVLQKQEMDASLPMAQKQALQERIIDYAKPRDAGPPKKMQNTRFTRDWNGGSWGNNSGNY